MKNKNLDKMRRETITFCKDAINYCRLHGKNKSPIPDKYKDILEKLSYDGKLIYSTEEAERTFNYLKKKTKEETINNFLP